MEPEQKMFFFVCAEIPDSGLGPRTHLQIKTMKEWSNPLFTYERTI